MASLISWSESVEVCHACQGARSLVLDHQRKHRLRESSQHCFYVLDFEFDSCSQNASY